MFLNELETTWRSASFTTILSLASLTFSLASVLILRRNSATLRTLEQRVKFREAELSRQLEFYTIGDREYKLVEGLVYECVIKNMVNGETKKEELVYVGGKTGAWMFKTKHKLAEPYWQVVEIRML